MHINYNTRESHAACMALLCEGIYMINFLKNRLLFILIIIFIILLIFFKLTNEQVEPEPLSVLIVVDEEYRSNYHDWEERVKDILEKADNEFVEVAKIDFKVKALGKWKSYGNDSTDILKNLQKDWDGYDYQFVIGVTRDPNFREGGIAPIYQNKPVGSAFSIVYDQGEKTYLSLRHELSHNFGLSHHGKNSKIKCIMNYSFLYNFGSWENKHIKQLNHNKKWYTTRD
jgi:predicted Zn-dependent protease